MGVFGGGGSSGPVLFDISTLSLTLWLRAGSTFNVGTGAWTGTASAGTSGSHSCTGVSSPTAGDPIVGLTPPHLDNSTYNGFTTGAALSTFVAAGASSGWAIFNGATASAGGTLAEILGDTGPYRITTGDGAVKFSGAAAVTVNATGSANDYHLAMWYHDGTNVYLRVDSGAWSSNSAGNISSLTNTLKISQGAFAQTGDIVEIGLTNTVLTRTQLDNVRDTLRSTYKLNR